MCWSQLARVHHLRKKWRVGRKKNSRKMGTAQQAEVSTRGRRAIAGRRLSLSGCTHFFEIFYFKK
jgi:hypothetical protein